jgi:glycosyltransferase involved in cell wall biosynthesis
LDNHELVSVIIPCFNQGQYLQEAAESALASTYQNIEIIIVDDGSTENTEFLDSFSAPKTKIIRQQNQGVATARNNGINSASGKYILPLDADDKIHPEYIKKAVEILENNPQIKIVYSEAEFFGAKTGKWKLKNYNFPNILYKNVIFCSAVFNKSDWKKANGYKKEMEFAYEDWEFWLSIVENGAKVFKIPEVLFYYRQHRQTRSETAPLKKIKMLAKIISLHKNLYVKNFGKVFFPLILTIISILFRPFKQGIE